MGFCKGGPGSGKSVLALSLARDLADLKGVSPIFSRLNRSLNALSFEVTDALGTASDDYDIWSYIEAFKQSGSHAACLIIDGLDEIGSNGSASQTQLVEMLIRKLNKQVRECQLKYQKSLRVIVFGRDILTENMAKILMEPSKLFTMGNMANRFSDNSTEDQYGPDLRPEWWQKFLRARGGATQHPTPDFLSTADHSLYQLGKEPLLAYLITLSALKPGDEMPISPTQILNQKVSGKNRNRIYEDIVGEVLNPKRWREEHKAPLFSYKDFHDILKYLALATWQNGNSRRATLSGVRRAIGENPRLRLVLNRLTRVESPSVRNFHSGNLITAFYYRLAPTIADDLEDEFEFTHKTFSEYLLATLLFDQFEALIECEINAVSEVHKLEAARKWLELTIAGSETHGIATFILDEAKIRWSKRPFEHWCKAFRVIDFILARQSLGFDAIGQWPLPYSNIETYSRGVEFIYFFWAAVNAKNWKETGVKFNNDHADMYRFSIEEIARFQRPMYIDKDGVKSERIHNKTGTSFTGYSLSGHNIQAEDLTGANFHHGHISGTDITDSHLICSVWQGTVLEDCVLTTVSLTQSMFNSVNFKNLVFEGCDLNRSWFEGVIFDFSTFKGCSIKQVYFYDCVFNHCDFEQADFELCHFVDCQFKFATPFEGEPSTDSSDFLENLETNRAAHASLNLPEFKNCFFGNLMHT